jgi:hypothetical protein
MSEKLPFGGAFMRWLSGVDLQRILVDGKNRLTLLAKYKTACINSQCTTILRLKFHRATHPF